MRKILIPFLIFLFVPFCVWATCPVCSVAVAGGVGLSRWLGIDDTISGIWIGGLIASLSLWTVDWFKKRKINFPLRNILVLILFYLITIIPLYRMKLIGHSCNQLWGFDGLILGIIFGSLAFSLGVLMDRFLRKKNNERVYFHFQKIIVPLSFLVLSSVVFYFLGKC